MDDNGDRPKPSNDSNDEVKAEAVSHDKKYTSNQEASHAQRPNTADSNKDIDCDANGTCSDHDDTPNEDKYTCKQEEYSDKGQNTDDEYNHADARETAIDPDETLMDKKDEVKEKTYRRDVPKRFSFYLTSQEWEQIQVQETQRDRKLSKNWMSVFVNNFKLKVPSCPLKVTRNYVQKKKSRKSGSSFFSGKAACKFQGCIEYSFKIRKPPKDRQRVKVRVKVEGESKVTHDHGIRKKRHFQGEERTAAKRRIKEIGSTNFFYERMADADADALRAGNLTGVGNKSTIQKLSSEINLENRIHRDLVTEITVIKRMCFDLDTTSRIVKGYVQLFAIEPFCVHLYTEDQLEHLYSLIRKKNGDLYFDATDTVVRKVEGQEKPVFYYPLLAKGADGQSAFPVAEMITNSHATPDIANFLLRVFRSCCLLHPGMSPPQKVEVDFSWALINGIVLSFNQENTLAYISRAAKIAQGHDDKMLVKRKTVVHICSAHVMHFMSRKFTRSTADKGLRQFLMYFLALMIDCTLLDALLQLFKDICAVLLAPTQTSHAYYCRSLEKLQNSMKTKSVEADAEHDLTGEEEEDEDDTSESSTFKDAYFGRECQKIRQKVEKALKEDDGMVNKYASTTCLNAIQSLVGTAPFWTGLMLGDLRRHQEHDVPVVIRHDTNALAENWMGIVKRHILKGQKRMQPGTFISKMYIAISGRVKEMQMIKETEPALTKGKKQEESGLLEEEKWCKKTKKEHKVKKGKYFQNIDEVPGPKTPRKSKTKKEFQKDERTEKVLHWGGKIAIGSKTITLLNTCPVDNLLYMLFRLNEDNKNIKGWIQEHGTEIPVCGILLMIFKHFRSGQWDLGRQIWLEQCCGFTSKDSSWNVFGSEAERFVLPFAEMQETMTRSCCSSRRCPKPERLNVSREILLSHEAGEMDLQTVFSQWENAHTVPCMAKYDGDKMCKGKRHWDNRVFTQTRPPVLIASVSFLSSQRGLTADKGFASLESGTAYLALPDQQVGGPISLDTST